MKLSLKMNVTATSIEAAAVGRYSSQTFQRHNGENHARGMLKMIFWCLQQYFSSKLYQFITSRNKKMCYGRRYSFVKKNLSSFLFGK